MRIAVGAQCGPIGEWSPFQPDPAEPVDCDMYRFEEGSDWSFALTELGAAAQLGSSPSARGGAERPLAERMRRRHYRPTCVSSSSRSSITRK